MNNPIVGVKLPVSGTGWFVAIGEDIVVGIDDDFAVDVAIGDADAKSVGVADGVDSKAGPSAAETTNVLVSVLSIPLESFHFNVNLCSPGSKSFGGFQFQSPFCFVDIVAVWSSDSICMSIC